jgi:hypothetical protein
MSGPPHPNAVNGGQMTPHLNGAPDSAGPHTFRFLPPSIGNFLETRQGAQVTNIRDTSVVSQIGFGGYTEDQDLTVVLESNSTIHTHYYLDKSGIFKWWFAPQDHILVLFRNYPAVSMPYPAGVPRFMICISMCNWWLQHGEGRQMFGRLKNSKKIRDFMRIIGSRTSAAVDDSNTRADGSENITITAGRRARVPNYWAVEERLPCGTVMNSVQTMDTLWFLMVRVKEDNKYKKYDTPDTKKDVQDMYYWRWQPHRSTHRGRPGWYEYNSDDPTRENDFTGFSEQWGYAHQYLDRYGGNPLTRERAERAVYPTENCTDFIEHMRQLPHLETMAKCA